MKYLNFAIVILTAKLFFAFSSANAETVNPASNVTADTANTPGTIVLRDSSTGATNITVQSGAIDTAKLATDSVIAAKILNATIDSSKLATGSVDTNRIGVDAVTTAKILNASVNTAKISTATNDSGKILASCGGQAMWRVGGTCP